MRKAYEGKCRFKSKACGILNHTRSFLCSTTEHSSASFPLFSPCSPHMVPTYVEWKQIIVLYLVKKSVVLLFCCCSYVEGAKKPRNCTYEAQPALSTSIYAYLVRSLSLPPSIKRLWSVVCVPFQSCKFFVPLAVYSLLWALDERT